jgi:hypothetical protein
MRPIHWMFVISLFLFVGGVVFVVAAERTARAAAPRAAAVEVRAAAPVATVKQVMQGMIMPASSAIWDSVATIVSAAGVEEKMPRTDEEWAAVGTSAAMLVEAANLLVEGDRAVDQGDWLKMARAMAESGRKALAAAEARSTDGILAVGEEINTTCDACHERYSRS